MPRRESLAPSPAKATKAAPAANTNTKSPAKAPENPAGKSEEKEEEKPKKEESKVEIVKDASGLGLSIVGGKDTPLVRNNLTQKIFFNLISIIFFKNCQVYNLPSVNSPYP